MAEPTHLPGRVPGDKEKQDHQGSDRDAVLVDDTFLALDRIKSTNAAHPIHWSPFKKWAIASIYCLLQIFVTISSTSYVSAEFLITERFGGAAQVVALGQSMFIVGNAVGPAFLGPLSYVELLYLFQSYVRR